MFNIFKIFKKKHTTQEQKKKKRTHSSDFDGDSFDTGLDASDVAYIAQEVIETVFTPMETDTCTVTKTHGCAVDTDSSIVGKNSSDYGTSHSSNNSSDSSSHRSSSYDSSPSYSSSSSSSSYDSGSSYSSSSYDSSSSCSSSSSSCD
jgi:hypothetical protein